MFYKNYKFKVIDFTVAYEVLSEDSNKSTCRNKVKEVGH